MATYPTTFTPELRFLTPSDDLGERGSEAVSSLAAHGFVVATGVYEPQVDNLASIAQEPHVEEYCPNDGVKRFVKGDIIVGWLGKGGGRGMVSIYDIVDGNRSLDESDIIALNRPGRDWGDAELAMDAYGWSGAEKNKHVPGADITTAYRVSSRGRELAFNSRSEGGEDRFRLGYPLGELVIATAVKKFGADPAKISLETWGSNKANDLYDQLGFVEVARQEDIRPTLKAVGTVINGHEVYLDEETGGNHVADVRLFKVLANHPLLQAA